MTTNKGATSLGTLATIIGIIIPIIGGSVAFGRITEINTTQSEDIKNIETITKENIESIQRLEINSAEVSVKLDLILEKWGIPKTEVTKRLLSVATTSESK